MVWGRWWCSLVAARGSVPDQVYFGWFEFLYLCGLETIGCIVGFFVFFMW